MRERERLVKVTSEAQLKPGLLVELRRCRKGEVEGHRCGRTHRVMLLRNHGWCVFLDAACNAWSVVPGLSCSDVTARIGPERIIAEGRLFIVDTGLEDETQARASKSRPRVVSR